MVVDRPSSRHDGSVVRKGVLTMAEHGDVMQGVAGSGCPRASSGGMEERLIGFEGGVSGGVAVLWVRLK